MDALAKSMCFLVSEHVAARIHDRPARSRLGAGEARSLKWTGLDRSGPHGRNRLVHLLHRHPRLDKIFTGPCPPDARLFVVPYVNLTITL